MMSEDVGGKLLAGIIAEVRTRTVQAKQEALHDAIKFLNRWAPLYGGNEDTAPYMDQEIREAAHKSLAMVLEEQVEPKKLPT